MWIAYDVSIVGIEAQNQIEEVKHRIDREYEKIFFRRMEEMRILKQTKAIKEINQENPDIPGTKFYNQLIISDRK